MAPEQPTLVQTALKALLCFIRKHILDPYINEPHDKIERQLLRQSVERSNSSPISGLCSDQLSTNINTQGR